MHDYLPAKFYLYTLHVKNLPAAHLSDLLRSPLFIATQRNHALSITDSAPQSLADEFAVYARIKEEHYDMCRSTSSISVRSNDTLDGSKTIWDEFEVRALLDLYESRLHLLRTEDGRIRFWPSVAKLMEARGFYVRSVVCVFFLNYYRRLNSILPFLSQRTEQDCCEQWKRLCRQVRQLDNEPEKTASSLLSVELLNRVQSLLHAFNDKYVTSMVKHRFRVSVVDTKIESIPSGNDNEIMF